MRVGKKHNKSLEVRQTRSCVVRLEKVSTGSSSPEESRIQTRNNRFILSDMAPTKGRKAGHPLQKEDKANISTSKRKIVSGSYQTPQTQKSTNNNSPNIRPNQKIKVIPKSNKGTPSSTPSREESPPPTIAAGRSRRAIKPNPKYASEDMVTSKVVRNVGMLGSSASRGGTTGQNKARKASTSSDDFYNRNSEDDEYDNFGINSKNDNIDEYDDKAYQVSEKEDHDSDFSVIEEASPRYSRPRGRQKRNHETSQAVSPQNDNKLSTQARSNPTATPNSSNLRSAPSQLQQIRRSLASANSQRNMNLLVGSSGSGQKRKLDLALDSSDNESDHSLKRKQFILSNSSGQKVKLPARENKMGATSFASTKSRIISQTQQPVNGSNKINNVLASSRKAIEIAVKSNSESNAKSSLKQAAIAANIIQYNKAIVPNPIATQVKMLGSRMQKVRSGSPKPGVQKEKHNNGAVIHLSSGSSSSSSSLKTNNKVIDRTKLTNTQSTLKAKALTPAPNSKSNRTEIVHKDKDDSPNSTMDDFETMPTFTIVNVNDIINKKGDVLITKTKSNKPSTVIELSESISLDDDDDDNEDNGNMNAEEDLKPAPTRQKQIFSKKLPKQPTIYKVNEVENKKSTMARSSESLRKLPTELSASTGASKQAPQILNHKLGLKNSRVAAKATTTLTATLTAADKPAPRILNSVVAKKTQPVKPLIANMEDSADESFPLSLDEDEDAEEETEDEKESRNQITPRTAGRPRKRNFQHIVEVDTEDTESQNTEEDYTLLDNTNTAATKLPGSQIAALGPKQNTSLQRRKRTVATANTPIIVSSNKKRLTPAAAKENSLAATNRQANDSNAKQPMGTTLPMRKSNTEKVVISKQGDKIIKKITCFETWYVINMPAELKRPATMKNQLEMPLIQLANQAKNICLPNNMWTNKITLYELSPQSLIKGTFATFTGDLQEHNISEEDRGKYQPSCVMFRRSMEKGQPARMPYDRAVIFKNKTFYTNIEGKNIRLLGAPSIINCESEIEILLQIVDSLTLQSDFVELISVMQ